MYYTCVVIWQQRQQPGAVLLVPGLYYIYLTGRITEVFDINGCACVRACVRACVLDSMCALRDPVSLQ